MSRNTSNRQIEQLDPGSHRDLPNNGPAVESANARVDLVGPFRLVQVPANQAATALSTGVSGADGQPGVIAHSSGKILGMTYSFNAAVTAGGASAASFQPTVAPAATLTAAAAGDAFAVASQASPRQAASVDETNEVAFNKGDALGCTLATGAAFAPTTVDVDVFLIVRWNPSPGVPA